MKGTVLSCIVFMLFFQDGFTGEGEHWGYHGSNGAKSWGHSYPHCAGKAQSPINIVTNHISNSRRRPSLFVTRGYDRMSNGKMTLINNGHAVQVNLPDDSNTVSFGMPFSTYVAAQFHFHWGASNDHGSEHAIDGKLFPMEIHIVHFNRKYGSLAAAIDKRDGLAVLATFVKVGRLNEKFQNIIKHFKNIQYKGNQVTIQPLPLIDFVSANMAMFYRYHGSLTTPPCYESVTWTVFSEPIEIASSQLEQFRTMLFENDDHDTAKLIPLSDNCRPLQNCFGRLVMSLTRFQRFPIRLRSYKRHFV